MLRNAGALSLARRGRTATKGTLKERKTWGMGEEAGDIPGSERSIFDVESSVVCAARLAQR